MMLIKLFIFFLLLLILPDWYIYRAYIHRVSYHKNGFAGLIGYQHYSWSQG